MGGGTIRDVFLGALPPATFVDWRYLLTAACGGLLAFGLSSVLDRLSTPILVLDAVGLSVFAVLGASKAVGLEFGYDHRGHHHRLRRRHSPRPADPPYPHRAPQ